MSSNRAGLTRTAEEGGLFPAQHNANCRETTLVHLNCDVATDRLCRAHELLVIWHERHRAKHVAITAK